MIHFPDFMKNPKNKVDPSQQNTVDVEGFYCEGKDKLQVVFWECHSDQKSEKHKHDFEEYMVLVSGEYIAYLNNKKVILFPGDELYIPKGTEQ